MSQTATRPTWLDLLEQVERSPLAPRHCRLAAGRVLEEEDISRICQATYAHEDELRAALDAQRLLWAERRASYRRAA